MQITIYPSVHIVTGATAEGNNIIGVFSDEELASQMAVSEGGISTSFLLDVQCTTKREAKGWMCRAFLRLGDDFVIARSGVYPCGKTKKGYTYVQGGYAVGISFSSAKHAKKLATDLRRILLGTKYGTAVDYH